MTMGKYLYIWLENKTHFKIKCYPLNGTCFVRNLKKRRVNSTVNKMRRDGWQILVKKPNDK